MRANKNGILKIKSKKFLEHVKFLNLNMIGKKKNKNEDPGSGGGVKIKNLKYK